MVLVCPRCKRRYEGDQEYCEFDGEELVSTLLGQELHGRYRVEEYLGGGGMGDVYRVHDKRLSRDVALKVMRNEIAATPTLLRRFRQEAQAVAALRNQHTVTLFDYETEGMLYFTMELVEGKSLGWLIDQGPIGLGRSLAIIDQVCQSLEEAHGRGIVHRDLKPDNITLLQTGGGDFAKVLDFGVAKVAGGFGSGEVSTASGALIGTPAYMSPEQAAGEKVTAATDQYSLGVILFEMLAGKPPFEARTTAELMVHHMRTPPPLLSEVSPDLRISGRVDLLLQRLLAKEPGARFASISDLRGALKELMSRTASPTHPQGHSRQRGGTEVMTTAEANSGLEGRSHPSADRVVDISGQAGQVSGSQPGIVPAQPPDRGLLLTGLVLGALALGALAMLVLPTLTSEPDGERDSVAQRASSASQEAGDSGDEARELAEAVELERQRASEERKRAADAEKRAAEAAEEKSRLEAELAAERQAKEEQARKAEEEKGKAAEAEQARKAEDEKGKAAEAEQARKAEEAKRKGPQGLEWVYSAPAKLDFSKTETTVAQYRACVEAGACSKENHRTKADTSYCNWGHSDRDDHPMNCVNWDGATQFCAWVDGRLPTEDEWYAEASNGGSRQYPWGDTEVTCDLAIWGDGSRTDGCGRDSTWPVCSKTAGNSVSGLCDMSGNVWEWTSTQESSGRVLRGGSWNSDVSTALRASGRYWFDPGDWFSDFGVRCVRVSQ